MVLSSPISGRQLLHEMTLAARISQRVWQTSHKIDDGTWFESHGLRIDRATRDALNMLDIRKLTIAARSAGAGCWNRERPAALAVVEALQRIGTETMFEACGSLNRLQRDSHIAEDRTRHSIGSCAGCSRSRRRRMTSRHSRNTGSAVSVGRCRVAA